MGIDDLISKIKDIDDQIKNLSKERKVLESQALGMITFKKEGQETHMTLLTQQKYVTKAGYYYEISDAVEVLTENELPHAYNPFKKKETWELDKTKYKQLDSYPKYKEIVDDFLERKPKPVKLEVL